MKAAVFLYYNELSRRSCTNEQCGRKTHTLNGGWTKSTFCRYCHYYNYNCYKFLAAAPTASLLFLFFGYGECTTSLLCFPSIKYAFSSSQLLLNISCNSVENRDKATWNRHNNIFHLITWKGCYKFQETVWMQPSVTPDKSQCKCAGLEEKKKKKIRGRSRCFVFSLCNQWTCWM